MSRSSRPQRQVLSTPALNLILVPVKEEFVKVGLLSTYTTYTTNTTCNFTVNFHDDRAGKGGREAGLNISYHGNMKVSFKTRVSLQNPSLDVDIESTEHLTIHSSFTKN